MDMNHPKIIAFITLVTIQVGIVMMTKISIGSNYSPASVLVIAEFIKLILSTSLHYTRDTEWNLMPPDSLLIAHFILAILYCINNQLSFYILSFIDPASLALAKSSTTIFTALLRRQSLHSLHWCCIFLQVLALIITQYQACTGTTQLSAFAYGWLLITVLLTSISSVLNEYILKIHHSISLHLHNMILYAFGVFFNIAIFLGTTSNPLDLFKGYTPSVIIVVLLYACMGTAITAVYKYLDAVAKCFAASATMAIVLYLSALYFNTPLTILTICGSLSLFITLYIYFILCPLFPLH